MPITEHQRALIRGRYCGQRTEFATVPRTLAWESLIRAALLELSRVSTAQNGKKLSVRQPNGKTRGATGSAKPPGGAQDDFALQRISAQTYDSPLLQGIAAASDLTNPALVAAALNRYHAAALTHTSNDALDKAILGSLLVEIYSLTGGFMKHVLRNEQRTDRDCQLFPAYRGVHFAAADDLGRLFGMPADSIDIFLQRQMIGLGGHGEFVDRRQNEKGHLRYLTDAEALAYRVEILDGMLYVPDAVTKALSPLDTTGPEWENNKGNTCHLGYEKNNSRGVSGFAMTLNRNLYGYRHSLTSQPQGAFYHSTYTGGSDVICTGCLTAVKGVLMYLNNFSGHYMPSPSQLQLVVDHLRTVGVPLKGVKVEIMLSDGKRTVILADDFLKNQGFRAKQFDFSERDAVSAKAKHVTDVVEEYLKRADKWYSKPSAKSLAAARFLQEIRQERNMLEEARFRVGQVGVSPFHTPAADRLDNGELKKRLVEALAKT